MTHENSCRQLHTCMIALAKTDGTDESIVCKRLQSRSARLNLEEKLLQTYLIVCNRCKTSISQMWASPSQDATHPLEAIACENSSKMSSRIISSASKNCHKQMHTSPQYTVFLCPVYTPAQWLDCGVHKRTVASRPPVEGTIILHLVIPAQRFLMTFHTRQSWQGIMQRSSAHAHKNLMSLIPKLHHFIMSWQLLGTHRFSEIIHHGKPAPSSKIQKRSQCDWWNDCDGMNQSSLLCNIFLHEKNEGWLKAVYSVKSFCMK